MMVLVDTSVWIDHLKYGEERLGKLLEEDTVFIHPWVIGELALGSLVRRKEFLDLLWQLPLISPASNDVIFRGIEQYGLFDKGLCWVDAGLLISCMEYPCRIWTREEPLQSAAIELGIEFR